MITRRALIRRYKASIPKFFQQSNKPNEVNGAIEAMEALNLATINVFSASMMLGGGLLYAFDISSVDDVRRAVRSRIGAAASRTSPNRTDQEYEEEIGQWLASVLGVQHKKEDKPSEVQENVKEEK